MLIPDALLTRQERILFPLRALFEQNGYRRFSMSRFEEYDLYMQCKDFLVSDRVITFTDLDGRLMALKPDVTMSIVRHAATAPDQIQRVYYTENIYRAAGQGFREIMQAGVECIGDLGVGDVCQTIGLAAQALQSISPSSLLVLSHPAFLRVVMDRGGVSRSDMDQLMGCIQSKNVSGLQTACRALGLDSVVSRRLEVLARLYGPMDQTLPQLRALCPGEAGEAVVQELEAVAAYLRGQGTADMVQLDFSVASNLDYYDGIVFQGFVQGVPTGVLSGGQYGGLLQKLGKSGTAIGFAIYVDELEGYIQ